MIRRACISVVIGLLLFFCQTATADYSDHRNRKTDSLETALKSPHPPQGKALLRAYIDLMWGYLQTNGKRSVFYAQKALEQSYKMHALNARVDALRVLGMNAYGGGNYDEAIAYYEQALAVTDSMRADNRYEASDIDDNLSALYGSMGNVYNMQDKAHQAIACYQKALPIFLKYGWKESATILYYNVGELFDSMGNVEEAEKNYLEARKTGLLTGDTLLSVIPCKGLAQIYIGRGDYKKAEQLVDEGLDYYSRHRAEEPGDYLEMLIRKARILMKGYNNLEASEKLSAHALTLITDDTYSENRANLYNLLCEQAMARRQWRQALSYALQVLQTDSDETFSDIGTYVYLVEIYSELGDNAQVKHWTHKIYTGMERFASEHFQSGLSQMQVLYETEKKQAHIEQLIRERRWYLWGGILCIAVLMLTALLFFLLWRSIKLSKRHDTVKAKLEGERSERIRIAHDLHDRLGGLLTAIQQSVEPTSTAAQLASQASAEMRNVAHHLLPDALSRHGLRVALRDFCATFRNVTFSFMGNDGATTHDEALYCIVHELVNNAVKSSGARRIQVQLINDEHYVAVNVTDDGVGGASADNQGMGLRNLRDRVEALGGRFDLYSKPGEGTEVNIELGK